MLWGRAVISPLCAPLSRPTLLRCDPPAQVVPTSSFVFLILFPLCITFLHLRGGRESNKPGELTWFSWRHCEEPSSVKEVYTETQGSQATELGLEKCLWHPAQPSFLKWKPAALSLWTVRSWHSFLVQDAVREHLTLCSWANELASANLSLLIYKMRPMTPTWEGGQEGWQDNRCEVHSSKQVVEKYCSHDYILSGGFKILMRPTVHTIMKKTFIEQPNCAWHIPEGIFLRLKGSTRNLISSEKSSLVTLIKGIPYMLRGPRVTWSSLLHRTYDLLKWSIYLFSCLLSVPTMKKQTLRTGTASAFLAALSQSSKQSSRAGISVQ